MWNPKIEESRVPKMILGVVKAKFSRKMSCPMLFSMKNVWESPWIPKKGEKVKMKHPNVDVYNWNDAVRNFAICQLHRIHRYRVAPAWKRQPSKIKRSQTVVEASKGLSKTWQIRHGSGWAADMCQDPKKIWDPGSPGSRIRDPGGSWILYFHFPQES